MHSDWTNISRRKNWLIFSDSLSYLTANRQNVMRNAMTTHRISDSYERHLYDFANNILVVCPSCEKQAIVLSPKATLVTDPDIKIICSKCGFNKKLSDQPYLVLSQESNPIHGRVLVYGSAVDPFFQLPLWLTINVESNELWAYNYEHLTYLESIVEAKLRERNIDDKQNRSIGSRLPRWITSSKNRENIIKAIKTLKLRK